MKASQKNSRFAHPERLLLILTVVLQCVLLCYLFAAKKTAYHEDEYFSFGLANSNGDTFLYGDELQVPNRNDIWMRGEQFRNYIRTTEETRFQYGNVWYNQARDTHPPLYYTLIHTACSVFTGSFSWWYLFLINLVSFAVTQIYLFRLFAQAARSERRALVICAFWGFSLIGLSTAEFLRMYAMTTMFLTMFAFYAFRMIQIPQPKLRQYAAVGIVTFFGAMTLHFFLISAFLLTAFLCLYFLLQKRFRRMFGCGLSALAGVAASFAAFPASAEHLLRGYHWSDEPDVRSQIGWIGNLLTTNLFGIRTNCSDFLLYTAAALAVMIPILIPVGFLLRDTAFMKKLLAKVRDIPAVLREPARFDPTALILTVTSLIFILFLSAFIYYPDIQDDAIRYVMQTAPFLAGGVIMLCDAVVRKALRSKLKLRRALQICGTVLLAADLIAQHMLFSIPFVVDAELTNGRISEYTAGKDCILLSSGAIYLPCYCRMLENAGDIYHSGVNNLHFQDPALTEEFRKIFDRGQSFVLVMDVSLLYTAEEEQQWREFVAAGILPEHPDPETNTLPPHADETGTDSLLLMHLLHFDPQKTEHGVVEYFEALSGYTGSYCTSENTHQMRIAAYRFDPPA